MNHSYKHQYIYFKTYPYLLADYPYFPVDFHECTFHDLEEVNKRIPNSCHHKDLL